MRAAVIAALSVLVLCAQTPQDPDISRAQSELAHVQDLVEAGAASRAQLESARQSVAEAEENAFLRRTLYGNDATESDIEQMVAVTERRLDRRRDAVAKMQDLVDAGVASRLSLTDVLEQEDRARKEHDYAVTRVRLIRELAAMARREADYQLKLDNTVPQQLAERYDGSGKFSSRDFDKVNRAFERTFSKNLPVSAYGETALHRSLGFDHTGRVDVALDPDQPEGVWLRRYLAANHIPYFAFRAAMPGKATGPHIHIGPMSNRS